MNTRFHTIVGLMILMLGLAHHSASWAQDMTVTGANPAYGEQGAVGLNIDIIGTGFDDSIDKVSFKLPCNKKSCPDSDDIIVTEFYLDSSTTIKAKINILQTAPDSTFDIAVRSRGRGGKGTTYKSEEPLFTVKIKPNQEEYSCDDFLEQPLGTCTCRFAWSGDPAFIPVLLEDCYTSETLFLTNRIRGESDGSGVKTITAVPCGSVSGQTCKEIGDPTEPPGVLRNTFSGTTVIANTSHRASIRYLDIRFQGVDRGCGNGIESAVSFVLDADLPDPADPEPLNRNSFLNVRDIGIFSGGQDDEPLCHAIEIKRTDGYTSKYSTGSEIARDWKVYINDNFIEAGSYEQAGLVMLGMMPSEDINPPQVVGNSVGAGACGLTGGPVGILFGSLTPDPDRQIAGLVENNAIDMNGGCTDTGLLVVGDPGRVQTTVSVNKNTITDAYRGVDVDCNVLDVNFSGNRLTGDQDDPWPIGIFSEAQFSSTKGKPNRVSGYVDDYIFDNTCD